MTNILVLLLLCTTVVINDTVGVEDLTRSAYEREFVEPKQPPVDMPEFTCGVDADDTMDCNETTSD